MSMTVALAAKATGIALGTFTVAAQVIGTTGAQLNAMTAVGLASAAGLIGYGALRSETKRNMKDIASLSEALDDRLEKHRASLASDIRRVEDAVNDLAVALAKAKPVDGR